MAVAVDASVTVKGSPVRSLQKFIDAELTSEQRATVLRSLPPEYAERVGRVILATETIPVHALNQLTEAAAKARHEPVEQFARRAGRQGAEDAIKGIYRFFATLMTPAGLLAKATSMWSSLYNRGRLEVFDQKDTSAHLRLVDFPSEIAGCNRVTGWIERMAELTGAKNVHVDQTQCYSKGAPHCEWFVRWQ